MFNFNICTPSTLGILRTVHHSYLPDVRNNGKHEVVNLVVNIFLSLSTLSTLSIYIHKYNTRENINNTSENENYPD